jgi:hypothetical protein
MSSREITAEEVGSLHEKTPLQTKINIIKLVIYCQRAEEQAGEGKDVRFQRGREFASLTIESDYQRER